ncbi:hypothetical protein J2S43_002147 [Catenuloplanes nepalensis]|uniref:Methyltransferase n=1 Tax=Catenuloplanes nepalensis TaxID=587533 RepID=A0ABT9MQE7_9ACTN|nr:SAM-dependent methyltransferase [Catenuloplanes nepalensis]MDP9793635.1 hypothetical protein [Catenuloplanes nepalensis]
MAEHVTPPGIDIGTMHPARRYDYLLGGKDNFEADRASAETLLKFFPATRINALENRRFLRRAVTFLAREAGLRQFLDIGSGLPTAPNVHEVAQGIAPQSRVVYVDNDPIVLVHARALLTSTAEGATAYVDADLRDPARILTHPDLLGTLDLTRPVGLMLVAVMHFFPDALKPYEIVDRLVRAMPSGSYLAMSHGTFDYLTPAKRAELDALLARSGEPAAPRGRAEFARFLDGLELCEPGIVPVSEWRADDEPEPRPDPAEAAVYGAVARIP